MKRNDEICLEDVPHECPHCGMDRYVIAHSLYGYRVRCPHCNYSTKKHEKKCNAIHEWNKGDGKATA